MGEVALVVQHDGKAVTTSLMVAEVFGKKHIEEGYGREQRRIAA